MMAAMTEQTIDPEWFKRTSKAAHAHARAADSFMSAARSFEKADAEWNSLDEDCRSALHRIGVIDYCRPFVKSEGFAAYKLNDLKRHASFDRGLHDHLIQLRHQLIAHNDTTVLPGRLLVAVGRLDPPVTAEVAVQVRIRVTALQSITDRGLLQRCLEHMGAAYQTAAEACDRLLGEYLHAAAAHPEAQAAARSSSGTITPAVRAEPAMGTSYLIPIGLPSPPTAPTLVAENGGYAYRALEFMRHFEGDVHLTGADGHGYVWQSSMTPEGPVGRLSGPFLKP
jgi:hypothetical protein